MKDIIEKAHTSLLFIISDCFETQHADEMVKVVPAEGVISVMKYLEGVVDTLKSQEEEQ